MLSILSPQGVVSMPEKTPYRLQVFLSDETRFALREAAHEEYTSVQKLVEQILLDYLAARKKVKKPRHKDTSDMRA